MTKEKKSRQLPIRGPVVLQFDPDIDPNTMDKALDRAVERYQKKINNQTPIDSKDTKNSQNGDK